MGIGIDRLPVAVQDVIATYFDRDLRSLSVHAASMTGQIFDRFLAQAQSGLAGSFGWIIITVRENYVGNLNCVRLARVTPYCKRKCEAIRADGFSLNGMREFNFEAGLVDSASLALDFFAF